MVIKVFFEEQPDEFEAFLETFLDSEDSTELLIPATLVLSSLVSNLVEVKSSSDSSLIFSSSEIKKFEISKKSKKYDISIGI